MLATGVAFLVVRLRPPRSDLQADSRSVLKTDQPGEHPTVASNDLYGVPRQARRDVDRGS